MLKNARVIEDTSAADEVGLFDKVELYFEDDGETDTIQVVTSVRCDPLQGRISRDAPLGRAVLGKKQGDRVQVATEDGDSYTVVVRAITKGQDDGTGSICEWRRSTELTGPYADPLKGPRTDKDA